jgi:membrane-associated phospholipid phosphatase
MPKKLLYLILGSIVCLGIIISAIDRQPLPVIAQSIADPVIQGNKLALELIQTEKTPAQIAAKNLAIVHSAVYDTVNSINPTHSSYYVTETAPTNISVEASVISAVENTLKELYPNQVSQIETELGTSLAKIGDGNSKTQGITWGKQVAEKILTLRKEDGSNAKTEYTPSKEIGTWQPIPPDLKPASMPHWKNVKPFTMKSATDFRIAKIPTLESAEYTEEFNSTQAIGVKDSKTRTEDQTTIAKFWLDGTGTVTPAGHWNQIATDLATKKGYTLAENARFFALLNLALADASIIDADHKYTFNRWRPITAIQQADKDNNPQTNADANWTPLLTTPSSPAYVSGHSAFAGAADAILTGMFGDKVSFTTSADPSSNLGDRSFTTITQAAEEAGMSRVYGGVHWLSDSRDGLAAGRNLGKYVLENILLSKK